MAGGGGWTELGVERGRSFCNLDLAPRMVESSRLTESDEDDDDEEACSADMMVGGEREGRGRDGRRGESK